VVANGQPFSFGSTLISCCVVFSRQGSCARRSQCCEHDVQGSFAARLVHGELNNNTLSKKLPRAVPAGSLSMPHARHPPARSPERTQGKSMSKGEEGKGWTRYVYIYIYRKYIIIIIYN